MRPRDGPPRKVSNDKEELAANIMNQFSQFTLGPEEPKEEKAQ